MPNLLNSTPRLSDLQAGYITPEAHFFNRNHAPIPLVAPATYRLQVGGMVKQPLDWSLADIMALPHRQRIVSLACAGNRRRSLHAYQAIPDEILWDEGAISTGEWGGVYLREVLQQAGLRGDEPLHVAFEGLDRPFANRAEGFGASIPLDKAWGDDVLLATHLNGEPLTAKRGYPVRAIVGGYIGARSVKWLGRIHLQDQPSTNDYQAVAYRFERDGHPQNGMALAEQVLNSVMTTPEHGATLTSPLIVTGYAMPHGTCTIQQVEVSANAGKHWQSAHIISPQRPQVWCWWQLELALAVGTHELMVRATDDGGHEQPPHEALIWNRKGYINNAYHRVTVHVAPP